MSKYGLDRHPGLGLHPESRVENAIHENLLFIEIRFQRSRVLRKKRSSQPQASSVCVDPFQPCEQVFPPWVSLPPSGHMHHRRSAVVLQTQSGQLWHKELWHRRRERRDHSLEVVVRVENPDRLTADLCAGRQQRWLGKVLSFVDYAIAVDVQSVLPDTVANLGW